MNKRIAFTGLRIHAYTRSAQALMIALTLLVFVGRISAGPHFENATSSTEIAPTNKTTFQGTPDFDGSGTVDFADFLIFASVFGTTASDSGFHVSADLNGDGAVGFADFLIFVRYYGAMVSENSPSIPGLVITSGPNVNAVLSLDIDASNNKMDDGNTSGTVAGAGTDIVVEVFVNGLAGPIIGGELSFDTDMLTVKGAVVTTGLNIFGTIAKTTTLGGFPPGVSLTNGYLATITFTTASDVTGTEFTVSASMNVADGTNIGQINMIVASAPLTFNTTSPPSPPLPPLPPFSLSLDGDGAAGDQAVTTLDISPGSVATIQVFGRGIRQATGISARFEYDSVQVAYEDFDAGGVLPNAQVLDVPSTNPTAVEINLVSFGGQATADSGMVGNIRFRTMSAFSGTTLRLVHAELGRGTQRERVTFADTHITLQPAALTPDFNGDGRVDFTDFLLFTAQFGLRQGNPGYDARYDLDGDDAIGFGDFLIFGSAFDREGS